MAATEVRRAYKVTRRRSPIVVHVNQNVIRSNLKRQQDEPPITVRRGARVVRARAVSIYHNDGSLVARVVYNPTKPLRCGARVWIELAESSAVRCDDSNEDCGLSPDGPSTLT